MNVTYRCPECDQSVRVGFDEGASQLRCPACGQARTTPEEGVAEGRVSVCLVCGCPELFVRKNFNQRLGVAIILAGFAASSVTWFYNRPLWTYAILFATALVDVVLYLTVGNLLQCYRCHSEYRDLSGLEEHEAFSLETHERFRQQAARLSKPQRLERS